MNPRRGGQLRGWNPRRHQVTCLGDCGWSGHRMADKPEQALRVPCPRCGAPTGLVRA